MNKNIWYYWILAARPKTLTASVAPVLIGTVMAYKAGSVHIFITAITLLAALAIQIGTNFANDYFDFKNGADTIDRLGPARMTQNGFIKPHQMRNAFVLSFAIAVILGFLLLLRGEWPIFWIGIFSIICGILYTGGPYPFGYHGFGDILVLIFFGPVAVGGTYYLQTLNINFNVILVGFAPGLISTAILAINNLRDVKSDSSSGKHTLAVIYGVKFVKKEFFYCISIACLIPIILLILNFSHGSLLIVSVISYLYAIPLFYRVKNGPIDRSLNRVLAATSLLLIIYTVLFVFCW